MWPADLTLLQTRHAKKSAERKMLGDRRIGIERGCVTKTELQVVSSAAPGLDILGLEGLEALIGP